MSVKTSLTPSLLNGYCILSTECCRISHSETAEPGSAPACLWLWSLFEGWLYRRGLPAPLSGELSVRYVQSCTAQWLLYVPPSLTKKFMFCPHSVFKFLVGLSEQTVIIFHYTIKWIVFVREMECVYCVVQTESWDINQALKW